MKYILLTLGEYIALNNQISLLKGYDLSKSTARVFPVNPALAKINIVYDEEGNEISYDLTCYIKVSTRMQALYPEVFSKFTFVNQSEVNFTDEKIIDLVATDLNTNQINWYLQHYSEVGDKTIQSLDLDIEPRSTVSDEAVTNLVNNNITIITNE